MRATITFPTRQQAEDFAKAWSRQTLTGHTISAGSKDVEVTVYNVTEELKRWIDNYVNQSNLTEDERDTIEYMRKTGRGVMVNGKESKARKQYPNLFKMHLVYFDGFSNAIKLVSHV